MVEQSSAVTTTDSVKVISVSFNRSGTHYLITHSNGFDIYEVNRFGDMQKNKRCWTQAIEGGVTKAEFLYSTLYDVSTSQITDLQLNSCVAFVGTAINPNYPLHKIFLADV